MNTKLLMAVSAVVLGLIGVTLTFLPDEISAYVGPGSGKEFLLVFQLLGALYFAFAMLNWMAKGSIIGGIYNRPIALANFTHFLIGTLALVKVVFASPGLSSAIGALAVVYSILAVCFGFIVFTHPLKESNPAKTR